MANSSVSNIRLESDANFGTDEARAMLAQLSGAVVRRNLTISGPSSPPGTFPALNMAFPQSNISLAPGVFLTYRNVMLRQILYFAPEIVVNSPGAFVILDSCMRHYYGAFPPQLLNSLPQQRRPAWAPGTNVVTQLPLGACRRGPNPALCWATAYELVDYADDLLDATGRPLFGVQSYHQVSVIEEVISSACQQAVFATNNLTCVAELSSELYQRELASPLGWLPQNLNTSRQLAIDAQAAAAATPPPALQQPPATSPNSSSTNASKAVGVGVGVGVGVACSVLAAIAVLAWRRRAAHRDATQALAYQTASSDLANSYKSGAMGTASICPSNAAPSDAKPMASPSTDDHLSVSVAMGAAAAGMNSSWDRQLAPKSQAGGKTSMAATRPQLEAAGHSSQTLSSLGSSQGNPIPANKDALGKLFSSEGFAMPAALTDLITDEQPIDASINLAVDVERDVRIGPFLGSGMAGNVYQATYQGQQAIESCTPCLFCTHTRAANGWPAWPPLVPDPDLPYLQIAIKMFVAGADLRSFSQEISILGRTAHPNIVRLLGACFSVDQVALLEELCHGSLDE
ncbi:protein kinase domain-containing protein [Haematococcus lacustris]|uniref:Protein kinase domain-containing protein n=1 Tax=Haematococcus lacustris TaxID=44745 RepID=A0A699YXB6_HAELA|nr:protein kinase domain-containing protein [Haematococcus lacustris]